MVFECRFGDLRGWQRLVVAVDRGRVMMMKGPPAGRPLA